MHVTVLQDTIAPVSYIQMTLPMILGVIDQLAATAALQITYLSLEAKLSYNPSIHINYIFSSV